MYFVFQNYSFLYLKSICILYFTFQNQCIFFRRILSNSDLYICLHSHNKVIIGYFKQLLKWTHSVRCKIKQRVSKMNRYFKFAALFFAFKPEYKLYFLLSINFEVKSWKNEKSNITWQFLKLTLKIGKILRRHSSHTLIKMPAAFLDKLYFIREVLIYLNSAWL